MEKGEHANAAELFERNARDAADRENYLPAAHLYLQAGRARLLAGEPGSGEYLLRMGLDLLTRRSSPRRIALSGSLLVEDLRQMSQDSLAEELGAWLEQKVPELADVGAVTSPQKPARSRPQLKCLQCGAILRPADIERWGSGTILCVYCGSLIETKT